MFSSTTIALSTSGPIARNSPPSVITLIVFPETLRPTIPPITASGRDSDGWPEKLNGGVNGKTSLWRRFISRGSSATGSMWPTSGTGVPSTGQR